MTRIHTGPNEIGSNTPAKRRIGRFMPLMMAAKLLISLVTRAVAVENAAISEASSPSRTARAAKPEPVNLKPEGDRDRDDDRVEYDHHHQPRKDRAYEDGEAARGSDPEAFDDSGLKLEDRAEPHAAPARERQQGQDPGQEDLEHAAAFAHRESARRA